MSLTFVAVSEMKKKNRSGSGSSRPIQKSDGHEPTRIENGPMTPGRYEHEKR